MTVLEYRIFKEAIFANKDLYSQSCGFFSSHEWVWELDHKEHWVPKNWCFWTVALEKILESSLDCKEISQIIGVSTSASVFPSLPNSDLKKAGKITRPFRYDLNQIPYDYTVEVICIGLAKKFVWVFPCNCVEKTEWTFGQPNIFFISYNIVSFKNFQSRIGHYGKYEMVWCYSDLEF